MSLRKVRCPMCRSTVHECKTGDEGCLHCDSCDFSWQQCSDGCRGWAVFESSTYGLEIERCDDCFAKFGAKITDDTFRTWPEALIELALEVSGPGVHRVTAIGRAMQVIEFVETDDATEMVVPPVEHAAPVGACAC